MDVLYVRQMQLSPVKLSYLLNLLMLFLGRAFAAEASVERDLSAEFGSYTGGFVLYDHDQVVPFGDRLFAAPISSLWA